MKTAWVYLKRNHIRPCRKRESIDYQIGDSDASSYSTENLKQFLKFPKKHWNNWFSIVFRILNPRFKLTIQKKEVDFQSLVGYVGGYIGLFMGFALAQIPEIILTTMSHVKRLFSGDNLKVIPTVH